MNMRTSMATRSILYVVSATLFFGLSVPCVNAAVTVEIGDYRELALEFVKEKYDLSDEAARKLVRQTEQQHDSRIINSFEIPDGAILDFIRVDGNAPEADSAVTYEGSGIFHGAPPQLYYKAVSEALESASPTEQAHLREAMKAAVERGWFIETLTAEQRDALMKNNRAPGEETMGTQQVENVRILVVLTNFPHWDDRSPAQNGGNFDNTWQGPREHPLSAEDPDTGKPSYHTPGGPLSESDWDSNGLNNPSWSNSGMNPSGSNSSVSNHPRIEYTVNGSEGTSVDLRNRWFTFLFDSNNAMSVARYFFANSNGNLSIDGDRSDIVGPLESHHQLDRTPLGGFGGHDYAHQPGTPVIRELDTDPAHRGVPGLRGISADSDTDAIVTMGWQTGMSVSSVRERQDDGTWDAVDIDDRETDQYYPRRRIAITEGFDENVMLRVNVGGQQIEFRADAGFSLSDTLLTPDDVMDTAENNRLLSMCYYTHDHMPGSGEFMGSRPYQLAHIRNSSGRIDDIGGTVDDPRDHRPRPTPYDHDAQDHGTPNMGYFEHPNSRGQHNFMVWLDDLIDVLDDNNINPDGYATTIYLYPSDEAAGADQGGTSGPWSGAHVFLPNASPYGVVLPSDAGLYLTAHELGHDLAGLQDLYDLDFYDNNALDLSPRRFESNMMGPYSVMAHGGRRVDAFSRILANWVTPIAVTEDIIGAEVREIEGTLQDPVVYKLPGRPHYIAEGISPDNWQEFYLVENRNRTGDDYFGDISPRGLYIYHVDMRFNQYREAHPMVIVEQADGLFELESNRDGDWGDLDGDPFPGSTDNRNFTQLTSPDAWSHGWVQELGSNIIRSMAQTPGGRKPYVPQPGSGTDSFSRVANISDPGTTMTADLHVVPREVIVTKVDIPDMPDEVLQGEEDLLVQHLHFNNDDQAPNLSRGDVEIANLRLDESGSSQDDDDVDRVSLFDDTDDNNEFDPAVDTRIATATFQNQSAFFTDLNYRIPRGETRDVFITYDISDTASSSAGNSLGAGIARFDYIVPKIPGAVQRRVRNDIEDGLGDHRFPIDSAIVEIEEAPDTLTITPISRAPIDQPEEPEQTAGLAIEPGDENVPILSLDCEVDRDSVTIDRVLVDETGTMDAVAHITAARLYLDANADGQVDGGDTLLEETRFADEGGNQRASFDIAANPVRVTDSTPRSLLLTASISEDMPQEEPPLTLQYTLEDTTYISLVQSEDIVSDENFPMSSDVVSTPLPNEPPAPPTNVAASELADGSIQLTWDLSADDPAVGGEEDVVHYNIYRSTDPADFVDVSPADAYSTAEAGETEFTDLDAPLNVDLYYMMRAWDGVQEGPDSNVAGPVQAQDNAAPVFSDFDPEQGAEGVAEDTTIAFTVSDGASGVDQATLVFEVDGEDVSEAPETTISGSAAELRVEYDPPEDFDFLQTVAVRLQAADNAGNMSDEITYEFTVTGPPVHFIAGVITDADGNPEESVRVEAGDAFDMTDANGEYQIEGLSAGTYTVTPSKDGRSFQPEQRSVTVPPDVVEIDFTSQLGFDISGTVVTEDGDPLEGVTVTDGTHADTTGADGAWELVNVPAGTYGIVADLEGWTFEPAEISVTVNEDAGDSTGNVFTASIEVFAIGGTVRTLAGNRLAGIDVEALQDDEVLSTATTNANGVYQIDGLAPGSYLVRPVDDNYAFDPEDRQVDLTTDLVDIDFAAASLYTMTLPAGLGFVAVPVEPLHPEPENVFGDDAEVARWDPDAGEYAFAPSDNSVMQVRPGAGFWTRSAAATQLEVPGTAFSNTESLSLTAHRTWTMFGNPYDRGLPWEQVAIPEGGAVSSYGFIWDADANTYRLVSTAPGLGAVTVVPKHAGFWLRSISATQIEIEAPGTAPASAEVAEQVARKPADDAWIIPIVARGGGALDACSFAGVLPQAASDPAAYRMDNPPAVGSHVDLYFVGDGGRRLAVDVRGERPVQTWQFEVATDMPDTRVEVQMPDLSEVPNDKSVYLVDETAGKRMYARTLTTYSYDSGEGGARRFTLEVGDRSETGLMITAASAQAAGGAVSVSYTLSADAQVSVEVLNIAGRKIATLADGETAPAGLSTCGWNARNSSGSLVPNGRYLVLVEARADDGQQVQALVPVQLER